jgi:hypothetical protein
MNAATRVAESWLLDHALSSSVGAVARFTEHQQCRRWWSR